MRDTLKTPLQAWVSSLILKENSWIAHTSNRYVPKSQGKSWRKKHIRNRKWSRVTSSPDRSQLLRGVWPSSNWTDWHWKFWIALVPSKLSTEALAMIWLWLLARLASYCSSAAWLSSSLASGRLLSWFLGFPGLSAGKEIDCSIFAKKAAEPTCFVPALDETKYWQAGISCRIKISLPSQLQLLLYGLV